MAEDEQQLPEQVAGGQGGSRAGPIVQQQSGDPEDCELNKQPGTDATLDSKISELKRKRAEMMKDKRNICKELRNQKKRRKRLKVKAAQLSKEDLFDIMRMKKPQEDNKTTTTEEEPDEEQVRMLL